jgi:hypothetical protein
MPAKDKYHDPVMRALGKEGWTITREQIRLDLQKRHFWVDLEAAQPDNAIVVLVEVKGFETTTSIVDYLYSAVGQYVLYRAIIESSDEPKPLFMAVPLNAYQGILSEKLGELAIEVLDIKLIVFDPEREVVARWIT